MVPKFNGETEQKQVGELHAQALGGGVPIEESIRLLEQVQAGYSNGLDKARAARDLAKYQFRNGDPSWGVSIQSSLDLLDIAKKGVALNYTPEGKAITREEGASYGMLGRLFLAAILENNHSRDVTSIVTDHLRTARRLIKRASEEVVRPDQYEINMIAALAIAERYNHRRARSVLALGRAALISGRSESGLARHRNPELTKEDRKQARKRGRKRMRFAAKIVLSPDWYIEREAVREKAIDMLV